MDNDHPSISIQKLWEGALAQLEMQLTRAIFDTYLRSTKAIEIDAKGALVIETPSIYAADTLEHRHTKTVTATLNRLGFNGKVRFIAQIVESDGQGELDDLAKPTAFFQSELTDGQIHLVNWDPITRGYIQLPAYSVLFWSPYLGHGPFVTWQTIRSLAQLKQPMPLLKDLAAMVANNQPQKLIGREDRGTEGWLDALSREKVFWYEKRGKKYNFLALENLPLLSPTQVLKLPKYLQKEHKRFIDQSRLDYEEWCQLPLTTLSKGISPGKRTKRKSENLRVGK